MEASRIKRFYNTGNFMGYMKREAAGRRNNGR
jgi:hypothetical protein